MFGMGIIVFGSLLLFIDLIMAKNKCGRASFKIIIVGVSVSGILID